MKLIVPEHSPRIATRETFYKGTSAQFSQCAPPATAPDFISPSGSKYWYLEDGVIRSSDHWGNVSTCRWLLEGASTYTLPLEENPFYTGFCPWESFKMPSSLLGRSKYGNLDEAPEGWIPTGLTGRNAVIKDLAKLDLAAQVKVGWDRRGRYCKPKLQWFVAPHCVETEL